mmetsp:Transcript_42499/g.89230  ORF Transcript_42499/g.89230 Transcript_42499/m.89230 type:complete len:323 (-) Transcript_42499:359-1327(-)
MSPPAQDYESCNHRSNRDAAVPRDTKCVVEAKSILRQSGFIRMPAHWPLSLDPDSDSSTSSNNDRHVHFPINSSEMVTSIRTRPRTHSVDKPNLYYSVLDIERFKRDHRRFLRSQRRTSISNGPPQEHQKPQREEHDNTFWRSKAGKRWYRGGSMSITTATTSMTATVVTRPIEVADNHDLIKGFMWDSLDNDSLDKGNAASAPHCISSIDYDDDEDEDDMCSISLLSDDSSITTISQEQREGEGGGFFSSVFDYVTREAVSILTGPSSPSDDYSRYCHDTEQKDHPSASKQVSPSSSLQRQQYSDTQDDTSLHLIDTLYLF